MFELKTILGDKKYLYEELNKLQTKIDTLTIQNDNLKKHQENLQDTIDIALMCIDQYFSGDEQESDLVAVAHQSLSKYSTLFVDEFCPKEYQKILRKILMTFRFELQKYRENIMNK